MPELQSMPAVEPHLTAQRAFAVIRRRAPIVIVCFFVAIGVALAYSLTAQKQYTATAALYFNNTPLNQEIAGLQASPSANTPAQQDTNLQLLSLGDMARKTATLVGHGLTRDSVFRSMTFSPSGDTTVVSVASTLPSPRLAAEVANTYSSIFVNEQENAGHHYYESALRTVERQIARLSPRQAKGVEGLSLQNRAQSLATLAQVRSGTVSLVQKAAVPAGPSSPNTKRNLVVAGILGLLLGVALALLIERLDQTIREPSELEDIYRAPLLGAVPLNPALRRTLDGSRTESPPSVVGDTFQFIRARLRYFNVDRDLRTVAIVSAQPGDGKTTVSHWLANAAARMGSRVLLIEADLRRPTIAQEVGLHDGPGLTDILIGGRSFDDAVQRVNLAPVSSEYEHERDFDVIVAGALPPNPAAMLESQALAEVLERARTTYDFVVIDTAPLGAVSDAMPLIREVDGVVIVAQMDHGRRDAAQRLRVTLSSVDAPLLGVIANRMKSSSGTYGYEYGYSSNLEDADRVSSNGRARSSARLDASVHSSRASTSSKVGPRLPGRRRDWQAPRDRS